MPNKIISIIGKPNVGKSSLFNLISGNHIAAETSKPHTTRHLIDSNISINDNKITLFDTPGINFKDRKIFNTLSAILQNQVDPPNRKIKRNI